MAVRPARVYRSTWELRLTVDPSVLSTQTAPATRLVSDRSVSTRARDLVDRTQIAVFRVTILSASVCLVSPATHILSALEFLVSITCDHVMNA